MTSYVSMQSLNVDTVPKLFYMTPTFAVEQFFADMILQYFLLPNLIQLSYRNFL